jgi:hypothetical protein
MSININHFLFYHNIICIIFFLPNFEKLH